MKATVHTERHHAVAISGKVVDEIQKVLSTKSLRGREDKKGYMNVCRRGGGVLEGVLASVWREGLKEAQLSELEGPIKHKEECLPGEGLLVKGRYVHHSSFECCSVDELDLKSKHQLPVSHISDVTLGHSPLTKWCEHVAAQWCDDAVNSIVRMGGIDQCASTACPLVEECIRREVSRIHEHVANAKE
eukprot:Nk52_evm2s2524 gene=Nk52_evmTU2s2524